MHRFFETDADQDVELGRRRVRQATTLAVGENTLAPGIGW